MFGIFKKYSARMADFNRTTDECLELWAVISERDKQICAENILKISRAMRDGYETSADAGAMLSRYKQEIIRQHSLKNHMHPAFMQVQILMNLLYSDKRISTEHFQYTLHAFKEIIGRLTTIQMLEVERNLKKFIQSDSFFLIHPGAQKLSNNHLGDPDESIVDKSNYEKLCDIQPEADANVLVAEPHISVEPKDEPSNTDTDLRSMTPLLRAQYEYENRADPELLANCIAKSNGSDVYAKALYLKTRIIQLQDKYARLERLGEGAYVGVTGEKLDQLRSEIKTAVFLVNEGEKLAKISGAGQRLITQIHGLQTKLRKACRRELMDADFVDSLYSQIFDLCNEPDLDNDAWAPLNQAEEVLKNCDKYFV